MHWSKLLNPDVLNVGEAKIINSAVIGRSILDNTCKGDYWSRFASCNKAYVNL